jgi:hypothetical protein
MASAKRPEFVSKIEKFASSFAGGLIANRTKHLKFVSKIEKFASSFAGGFGLRQHSASIVDVWVGNVVI